MCPRSMMKSDKKKRTYRAYTPDFKKEVVAMAKEIGSAETSKKLDVPLSNIDKWKNGHAMKLTLTSELKELQDENKKLRRQHDQDLAIIEVLKKTAAIFSKEHFT